MMIAQFFIVDPIRTLEAAMGTVVAGLYMFSMWQALHIVRWRWSWCTNPANRLTLGRIFAALTVLAFTAGALDALIARWGQETTIRSVLWSLGFIFALARWAFVDRIEWRVL